MKSKKKVFIKRPLLDKGVLFLLKSFEERRAKNKRYSLRAFSRDLGVAHSTLSRVFVGKSLFSTPTLVKCLQQVSAPSELIETCIKEANPKSYWEEVSDDEFELISDWMHFCILELMFVPGFKLGAKKVSEVLGITLKEARTKIKRLLDYGYIRRVGKGYGLRTPNTTTYPAKKTSEANIIYQNSLLQKSQSSLFRDDFNMRDHSSMMIAVKKEDMPKFKAWIKDARRELSRLFQTDKDFDDVYCLQVAFFSLTERKL